MGFLLKLNAIKWPLIVAAPLAAATTALHLRDPHVAGSWGQCPTAAIGIYCPGCGGLRAVNDLTNLDLASAFSSNAVVVIGVFLFALWWTLWIARSLKANRNTIPVPPLWVMPTAIVLMIGFAIIRNFEFASYLQPSGIVPS